ncbi:TPA: 4-hydroxy-3-methylbut-2-enyl diphosphate reductase, partial [bacterium UBP9_UBA11836]|nr:4-hydroxy-3-methylbut-2-enyl diphosphate reductase [bacterium UBP9_UBA11836]
MDDNTQPTTSAEENCQDMAQALEEYEKNVKPISKDDFLEGKVISVSDDGVYVDVGYKTDGFIPANQVSNAPDVSPKDVVKVGDKINVVVQKVDESEGTLTLSKRRADNEKAWRDILEAMEEGKTITATCTEQVKGGLIVDV